MPGPAFEREREFFREYREALLADNDLQEQMELAWRELHARYDTAIRENRFIAGGVSEQIIGSSARALGLPVDNAGKRNQAHDLQLPDGGELSVKSVFASGKGAIRLINTQGRGTSPRWKTATIFPMANTGIGYADPDLLPDKCVVNGGALELSGAELKAFWVANPEWLAAVAVPPKKKDPSASRVASDAIAMDIFQDVRRLFEHWKPEI